MRQLLFTISVLIINFSFCQTDTIFVEFNSLNGQVFTDGRVDGIIGFQYERARTYLLPRVKIDTLRSHGDSGIFNGILVTHYRWISYYNPPIFRITHDSIVNGKSVKHSYYEIRSSNQVIESGYSTDSISVSNSYYNPNGSISSKIIELKTDSANVLTESFSYSDKIPGKIHTYQRIINGYANGLTYYVLSDSLTLNLILEDNLIVDILNQDVIFLDHKNRIISKEDFFAISNSKAYGDAKWDLLYYYDATIRTNELVVCYLEKGVYDRYDQKLNKRLLSYSLKHF